MCIKVCHASAFFEIDTVYCWLLIMFFAESLLLPLLFYVVCRLSFVSVANCSLPLPVVRYWLVLIFVSAVVVSCDYCRGIFAVGSHTCF
jgi:hypothetical protein